MTLKPPSTKSSRTTEKLKPTDTVLFVRSLSVVALFAALILSISVNVRWLHFELIVSYLPQGIILNWVVFFTLLIAYSRIMLNFGLWGAMRRVGDIWNAIISTGLVMLLVLFAWSNSLIQGTSKIAEQLTFESGTTRVGTFNKLYRSGDLDKDMAQIVGKQLDVIALQEVDKEALQQVQAILGYEFSYITNCGCSASDTDVGVISKYPITRAETLYEHPNSTVLKATIERTEDDIFSVYAVHMYAPVPGGQEAYELRGEAYDELVNELRIDLYPAVVMGDFNTTIFSPDMREFRADVGGFVQLTGERAWPKCSWFAYGELACLRIDHVFIPSGSELIAVEVGIEEFSDHRSVIAEFR